MIFMNQDHYFVNFLTTKTPGRVKICLLNMSYPSSVSKLLLLLFSHIERFEYYDLLCSD